MRGDEHPGWSRGARILPAGCCAPAPRGQWGRPAPAGLRTAEPVPLAGQWYPPWRQLLSPPDPGRGDQRGEPGGRSRGREWSTAGTVRCGGRCRGQRGMRSAQPGSLPKIAPENAGFLKSSLGRQPANFWTEKTTKNWWKEREFFLGVCANGIKAAPRPRAGSCSQLGG